MGEGRKGEVFYWYSIVAGFLDNDEIETPSDVSMEYLDDIFRKPPFCRVRPLVLDKIGSEIRPRGCVTLRVLRWEQGGLPAELYLVYSYNIIVVRGSTLQNTHHITSP